MLNNVRFQHTIIFMNNPAFEISDSTEFFDKALNDFLRDKRLSLTDQQYQKLRKLLMVSLFDEEMSYSSAYNKLSELVEYRKDYEINANAPDEAEEEIIHILGAADAQEADAPIVITRFKKRFFVTATLLVLVFLGMLAFQGVSYVQGNIAKKAAVITTAEEIQLKKLVAEVVALEKQNGITSASVYAQIKKLEAVQKQGEATSYKKFNNAQYSAAVEYLNARLQR